MNIIAAADKNWGIGKNNNLLDHIPEDMRFFKEKTLNKVVIMGKNTFLSLPGEKPLPERVNIVLTRDKSFNRDGITICDSIEKAVEEAKKIFDDKDIFFIGGEQVYSSAIDFCDTAYITKIDNEYEADRFLVNFDNEENWHKVDEEKVETKKGFYITFTTYKKK